MESVCIWIMARLTQDDFNSSVSKTEHKLCGVTLIDHAAAIASAVNGAVPTILDEEARSRMENAGGAQLCRTMNYAAHTLKSTQGYLVLMRDDMPLLKSQTVEQAIQRVKAEKAHALALTREGKALVWIIDVSVLDKSDALNDALNVELDGEEGLCVINRSDLARAAEIMRRRINEEHMLSGVTMIDPSTVYIDRSVRLEPDTVIYPNNILEGNTVIRRGTTLFADNRLTDCTVGRDCSLRAVTATEATVEDGVRIGPYTHLRPHTVLRKGSFAGAFVEMKNVDFGEGSKSAHLSYVGDADVGKKCNIGCGVVFVNYDGKKKHRSTVGDNCFIGSNSNLVAPVTIEDKGFIAAGSTVTEDVPSGALCIARSRQTVKEGWVERNDKK